MKFYLILCLFSFLGCANFTVVKNDSLDLISLSKVEQLTMGKSTKSDLIQMFGKPSFVLTPSIFEAWVYDGPAGHRATFSMNSEGIVLNALWAPVFGKECSDKNCMLAYFKNIPFKFEKRSELIGKHEYGYYLSYYNNEKGISINIPIKSNEVIDVTFEAPTIERSPATPQKQKL